MTVVDWDCWIGDESGGTQTALEGIYQPKPRPWPIPVLLGSEHQMLPSSSAPGALEAQRFGYRKILRVNLPRTTSAIRDGIEALFYRFSSGVQPKVQFNNAAHTYLCSWGTAPQIEPADDRLPERWNISFELLIESQVS